jgi:hypothetical protein
MYDVNNGKQPDFDFPEQNSLGSATITLKKLLTFPDRRVEFTLLDQDGDAAGDGQSTIIIRAPPPTRSRGDFSRVSLHPSCRNLFSQAMGVGEDVNCILTVSEINPLTAMFDYRDQTDVSRGSSNPTFTKPLTLHHYHLEADQIVRFCLYEVDGHSNYSENDLLARVTVRLSELRVGNDQLLEFNLLRDDEPLLNAVGAPSVITFAVTEELFTNNSKQFLLSRFAAVDDTESTKPPLPPGMGELISCLVHPAPRTRIFNGSAAPVKLTAQHLEDLLRDCGTEEVTVRYVEDMDRRNMRFDEFTDLVEALKSFADEDVAIRQELLLLLDSPTARRILYPKASATSADVERLLQRTGLSPPAVLVHVRKIGDEGKKCATLDDVVAEVETLEAKELASGMREVYAFLPQSSLFDGAPAPVKVTSADLDRLFVVGAAARGTVQHMRHFARLGRRFNTFDELIQATRAAQLRANRVCQDIFSVFHDPSTTLLAETALNGRGASHVTHTMVYDVVKQAGMTTLDVLVGGASALVTFICVLFRVAFYVVRVLL